MSVIIDICASRSWRFHASAKRSNKLTRSECDPFPIAKKPNRSRKLAPATSGIALSRRGFCVTYDVAALCAAGSGRAIQLAVDAMRRAVQVNKTQVRALFMRADLLIKDAKSLSAAVNARIASSRAGAVRVDRRGVLDRRRGGLNRRVDFRRQRPRRAVG
jgi:hypothetical protein